MNVPSALAGPKLATRLVFLTAGFATSCWAPLVPFAKTRIGADDAQLGVVLLCLGIGSLLAMPLTGWLSTRWGSKPMILGGGGVMSVLLPLLVLAPQVPALAATLLGFGAAVGTLDVAMNMHAMEVERRTGLPLMSNFHALFSLGGILGAGAMTALLSVGVTPQTGTLIASLLALGLMLAAAPRLLPARGTPTPLVAPHGFVLLLAALAAVAFLVEGAVFDWGALLMIDRGLAGPAHAGLGYLFFSLTMTAGRLTGDRLVSRLGNQRTLTVGGLVAIGGMGLILLAPVAPVAWVGFALVGIGAANTVPVLFRQAGRQSTMPLGLAVAAITTTAYAGILAGPAAVGFIAHASSLPTAFWLLAALFSTIPLCARHIARD